jgi:hypothetical protein
MQEQLAQMRADFETALTAKMQAFGVAVPATNATKYNKTTEEYLPVTTQPVAAPPTMPVTQPVTAKANGKPKTSAPSFDAGEVEGITASMAIANGLVTITFPAPTKDQWHRSNSGKSQTAYARIPASRNGNVVLGGGVNLWFK